MFPLRDGRGGGCGGPPGGGRRSAPQVIAARDIPNPAQVIGGRGPNIAPHRPAARGTAGRSLIITTNNPVRIIPDRTIHHYDEITGTEEEMTVQFNVELIRILQERIAPDIFTPRVIYDGRKSIFRSRALNLSGGDSQAFEVTMPPPREGGRPPEVYKVTLKKVAEIRSTLFSRYLADLQ